MITFEIGNFSLSINVVFLASIGLNVYLLGKYVFLWW